MSYTGSMSNLYFIGGVARSGKSQILSAFLNKNPIRSLATDALRGVLLAGLPDSQQPALRAIDTLLFEERRFDLFKSDSLTLLNLQQKEAAIVWRSTQEYLRHEYDNGLDCIVEGIHITPKNLVEYKHPHKAVFIGNQSDTHVDQILASARTNPHDWIARNNIEEDTVRAFAAFLKTKSSNMQKECSQYGYTYLEMSDETFNDSVEAAVSYLLTT